MFGQHRWLLGVAAGMSVLSIAGTGSLVMLAHRLVDELSRPHSLLNQETFTWTLPDPEPEPPVSYRRPLLFHTADGKILSGDFWAQSHPAPTVVICHGYRLTRSYLRPVAALEYKYGYNVLLFDFRGHGESDSVATSGGNAEIRDLEAALAVAGQQPETLPRKILIHGFSMGAAVALLIPPHPDVAAIIADSPYARLDEILRNIVHWQLTSDSASWTPSLHPLRNAFKVLSWATVAVGKVVFRLRFGYPLIARPDTSFKRWHAQSIKHSTSNSYPPILLIHGMKDTAVPIAHAHQLVTQARAYNITLETYFVDEATHCGSYGHNPQKYIQVLLQFLAKHLGNNFLQGPAA